MNPIESINQENMENAESSLDVSLAHLDVALSHLAEKVRGTAQKVHTISEIAHAPQREVTRIKDFATRAIAKVRSNPTPFILIAFGLITSYGLYRSIRAQPYSIDE